MNKVYFPFLSDEDLKLKDKKAYRNKNFQNLCLSPTAECDVIAPVDEVTGNRTNRLTKIFDPNLSPLEREKIMATLQRMPTAQRNNLSDDELISMLPSRYNSTMVDDAKYADYMRGLIDDIDTESDVQSDVDSNSNDDSSDTSSDV